MKKVITLTFNDSKEEKLYNWLINHKNTEKYIKRILLNRMSEYMLDNEEIEDNLFNPDYFRIEQNKETTPKPSFTAKDLQKLFDDDSFWE